MNTFLSILCAILIFGIIVIVHEFGHYIVAVKSGIEVCEFAIGMGPAIFKKQGKHTLFTVRLLPLGGFCQMGEDEEAVDENSFRSKPVSRRIAVIAAGAVMNLILGFILGFVYLIAAGKVTTSVVAEITPDTEFSRCGIQLGDRIIKVNGSTVFTAGDIVYQLRNDEDGILDFTVKRDGEIMDFDDVVFTVTVNPETGNRTLKYDFKVLSEKTSIKNIFSGACRKFAYDARLIVMSLADLVRGKYGLNDLQGPVGIVSAISGNAQQYGFDIAYLLELAMLISVNVGIFNLLPLPALDGGRLVFLIIEAIRRKAIKSETEGIVHFVGFALLMFLMAAVTFNDVKNLF
ncbi:MAG: RIP metalloprotease RseP [Huintestinicola sp.]